MAEHGGNLAQDTQDNKDQTMGPPAIDNQDLPQQNVNVQVSVSGTSVDLLPAPDNIYNVNSESNYMKKCRETGLTANPFANIVEKSHSIERERYLSQKCKWSWYQRHWSCYEPANVT